MEMMENAKPIHKILPMTKEEPPLQDQSLQEHFPSDTAAQCVPSVKSIPACSTPETPMGCIFANANDPSGRAVKSVHKQRI